MGERRCGSTARPSKGEATTAARRAETHLGSGASWVKATAVWKASMPTKYILFGMPLLPPHIKLSTSQACVASSVCSKA